MLHVTVLRPLPRYAIVFSAASIVMDCCRLFFFFFSSRRRHTRLQGDWSSDVCSSDLRQPGDRVCCAAPREWRRRYRVRSEERRVGKECRSRGPAAQNKEKRYERCTRKSYILAAAGNLASDHHQA